jgi:hypothetical protein
MIKKGSNIIIYAYVEGWLNGCKNL